MDKERVVELVEQSWNKAWQDYKVENPNNLPLIERLEAIFQTGFKAGFQAGQYKEENKYAEENLN